MLNFLRNFLKLFFELTFKCWLWVYTDLNIFINVAVRARPRFGTVRTTMISFRLKNIDSKIIYWLYKTDQLLIKQWIFLSPIICMWLQIWWIFSLKPIFTGLTSIWPIKWTISTNSSSAWQALLRNPHSILDSAHVSDLMDRKFCISTGGTMHVLKFLVLMPKKSYFETSKISLFLKFSLVYTMINITRRIKTNEKFLFNSLKYLQF